MALISTLGVPIDGNATTTIMPKLSYRFRVTFVGDDFTSQPTRNVITANRPSLQHDPIQLDSYNSRVYLAGKHSWAPVSVVFRDDVDSETMKQINKQMNKQMDHANQSGVQAGQGYKFGMIIETLDGGNPDPGVLDTYELAGCYITQVSYGDMNYGSSDQITMQITVQYDNCEIYDGTATETLSGATQNQGGSVASGAGTAAD